MLEVAERVIAFYRELQQYEIAQATVICHAGTIRMLQACARHASAAAVGQDAFENRSTIGYGGMQILDVT